MKPASFEYHRAENLEHALDLTRRYEGDANILAGGQSLVPMMNLRLARPEVLIDINHIGLHEIEIREDHIDVGALVRHRDLIANDDVFRHAPVIREAMRFLAHPTIRNRGTAGGSVAYADPTAEIPALLILLDGEVVARSKDGERILPAKDFFRSAFTTSLAPQEIITALRFRMPSGQTGACFLELAERHGDYAVASAAVTLLVDEGRAGDIRIALSGTGPIPVRATAAESLIEGNAITQDLAQAAGREVASGYDAYTDIRASAEYRRRVLGHLVEVAVLTAYRRAVGDA